MEGDVRFCVLPLLLAIGGGAVEYNGGGLGVDHVGAFGVEVKATVSFIGLRQSASVKVGSAGHLGNYFWACVKAGAEFP